MPKLAEKSSVREKPRIREDWGFQTNQLLNLNYEKKDSFTDFY